MLLTVVAILCLTPAVMPVPQRAGGASAEEYAVYSAVIPDLFAESQDRSVVIEEQTITDRTYLDNDEQYFQRMFPTLGEGVAANYKLRNKIPARLKDSFDFKMRHVVVKEQELRRILKDAGSWNDFYKVYPTSVGFVYVSRVGFNSAMNQALVYIGHSCGGLCGTGNYVLLEKTADRWRVVKREMVWIS